MKTEEFKNEPCGCHAHPEEPLTGHPFCEEPTGRMLALERQGRVVRDLNDKRWRWVVA